MLKLFRARSLIRAQEDKLKQMIPAQREQQLKQLYKFWSDFFKQHENQPGGLPKATAIDNKEFGHRQFVPYDLSEWKGLYDQYQDQIDNPDKNG